jgi:hypothetical protein
MSKNIHSQRLVSLDALRGFDMLFIMGADDLFHELSKITNWQVFNVLSEQMDHATWNGFRAYDMIFPLFLFITGVATPFSIGREIEKGNSKQKLLFRIFKRACILFLLGFIYNNGLQHIYPLEKLRFPSVLGRIGIAYLFANFIYLYSKEKYYLIWFISLLLGYWLLLRFTAAPGFHPGDFSMSGNFVSYIDRMFIPGSLYLNTHDPEGILSTIPAVSTGLLGIMTGSYLRNNSSDSSQKIKTLLVTGLILIAIAQLWNLDFPINKNLWTSSFALQAGGISIILLTIFYFIIDIKGYQKWAYFFKVIGMNSILIYMSAVFIDWEFTGKSFFGWLADLFGTPFDAIIIIFSIMTVKWLFLNFLYKKKIFLKV